MKKALICLVIAGLALVSVPVVAEACSSHGAAAASGLRAYLNGSNGGWMQRGRSLGDKDLSRDDVDGFQVEGSQYMVDGNWSNRTYWVRITDPFGQTVEFQIAREAGLRA